jgi:4-amino-4-deoxy-L-arabinose transferase-like glycosyltransferase
MALPWVFGERWYADTAYYQAIATQMAREGTWWSPMQGDLHYFNKPPLGFWIHAILVAGFGDADWAAHLPEGVCYVLTAALVAWLGMRLHGALTGVLAGCVMALTNDWVWRIANYRLDFPHTLLLLGACACWVRAFVPERSESRIEDTGGKPPVAPGAWCVLAGVCIGGALMVKPLMGLGLPLLGAAWLWSAGLWRVDRAKWLAVSGAVGAAIALPWHASMTLTHGMAFVRAYLLEQSVKRATGEMFEPRPWWWYFGHAVSGDPDAAAPWTMWPIYGLALAGLGVVAWRWRRGGGVPTRAGDALAALWTVVWIGALSLFVGKRNYYILVAHPGTAWLAGVACAAGISVLARVWGERAVAGATRGAAVLGVLACAALLARAPSAMCSANRTLPVPERDAFMAYLRERRGAAVYNCGLPYRMAALAYIQAGVWPRSLEERTPTPPESVPSGALMAYRVDMLNRKELAGHLDPKDRVVFRSSDGPLAYLVVERR